MAAFGLRRRLEKTVFITPFLLYFSIGKQETEKWDWYIESVIGLARTAG